MIADQHILHIGIYGCALNYKMKLRKARNYLAGDRQVTSGEETVKDIPFKVHKFTPRQKPEDTRDIMIFPMFSEFGCETLSVIYCLPRLLQKYFMGKYT